MGIDRGSYRRIKVRQDGLPIEGLYDSVIDARLQSILDAARKAGIDVGTRELKGRDGRLLARELADAVIEALGKAGFRGAAEGQETGDWVLIDAGDIVVHLFRPEIREHYHLEKMWSV